MALQSVCFLCKPMFQIPTSISSSSSSSSSPSSCLITIRKGRAESIKGSLSSSSSWSRSRNNNNNNNCWKKKIAAATAASGVPNSNYVVPLDNSSCIKRPLAEILRDLNKRVPDNIIDSKTNWIPWYHANRMLSFYAPGWCGEISDVIFSENGSVTVIYRVTIRGSDGEAHRESTGTVTPSDGHEDPVAAAEEIAFCKACARFGLGLYLYHEEETEM